MHNVVPTPKVPEWEHIVSGKVQEYAEFAARGNMTPKQALKNLDKDTDRILAERRWILSRE